MAVVKMNFLSKNLGMQTNISLFLPSFSYRDFVNNKLDIYIPGVKFQTLYLLHGGSGDDSDYLNLTNIACYAEEQRIAVVMPCDYNHFYTDDLKGPRYWKYVSEELPLICQSFFPLSEKREDNFIAGLSMGGYGAMKTGIMNCERYAAVLCMSGAAINPDKIKGFPDRGKERKGDILPMIPLEMIFGDLDKYKNSSYDVWYFARLNAEQGKKLPKFFLTVGDQDYSKEYVDDAYHYLTSLGYETFCEVVPGYGHEWDFWDLTLKKALEKWLPIRHDVLYPRS
jgi:putative tributyrin esterase